MKRPQALGLLAATMVTLLTTGCGLVSDGTGPAAERKTLKVGVMVGIDCSGVQLALQKRLFEEEGLVVEPETVQSGAIAIPKLAAGALDFTFGNWVSFMKAQAAGAADLRFISESYVAPPDSNFALITGPGSTVTGVRDLAGKTIAVNAKGNINELLIRAVLEAGGIDFSSVKLVEMGFADMAGALAAKTVDVAALLDPFVVDAQKTMGAKVVVDLTGAGPTADFPIAGFATTATFAQENPETVAAIQRVLLKGQQLSADRKNVEEALPKYAKMDPATAASVKIGQYPTAIDPKRLQRVADLLVSYGMLPAKLDVAPLVVPVPAPRD
ncbi:ABC transporter substrate-binding protein [Asanoa sp. NPDC050611]|uniref:ABC transporter substrate-binding protein n=1 Tax=Asanoa sp. NPDC050611 TaxID=3157098 RepID=UPI0033C3CA37